jgi:hypothetical protein
VLCLVLAPPTSFFAIAPSRSSRPTPFSAEVFAFPGFAHPDGGALPVDEPKAGVLKFNNNNKVETADCCMVMRVPDSVARS